MKKFKIILTVITLMLTGQITLAEEITLFNSEGDPIAYIDGGDEDLTIYMWNGIPVAYLDLDGNAYHIYGFNGKHLGWYENGIISDHEGYAVGFIEGATTIFTKFEPFKSIKQYKPYKAFQEFAPFKPFYNARFSNEPLSLFLMKGKH